MGNYLSAWKYYCCGNLPLPRILFITTQSDADSDTDGFEAFVFSDGFYVTPTIQS